MSKRYPKPTRARRIGCPSASLSTTVDPSSGTGATPSASSSDINKVIDAGKQAIVVKPARKFGVKGLALRRAPS